MSLRSLLPALVFVPFLCWCRCSAAAPLSAEVGYEFFAFDLETAKQVDVVQDHIQWELQPSLDFSFLHGSLPDPRFIAGNTAVTADTKLGVLTTTAFDSVDYAQASAVTLTAGVMGPIGDADTVVVRTTEGNLFKVGSFEDFFDPNTLAGVFVRFNYEQLVPVPEPSCLSLSLGPAVALVVLARRYGSRR